MLKIIRSTDKAPTPTRPIAPKDIRPGDVFEWDSPGDPVERTLEFCTSVRDDCVFGITLPVTRNCSPGCVGSIDSKTFLILARYPKAVLQRGIGVDEVPGGGAAVQKTKLGRELVPGDIYSCPTIGDGIAVKKTLPELVRDHWLSRSVMVKADTTGRAYPGVNQVGRKFDCGFHQLEERPVTLFNPDLTPMMMVPAPARPFTAGDLKVGDIYTWGAGIYCCIVTKIDGGHIYSVVAPGQSRSDIDRKDHPRYMEVTVFPDAVLDLGEAETVVPV
jgi:hypothetical protein